MTETSGYIVENCTKAGSSENGEYIRLTLTLQGGKDVTLFFPFKFFSGLMAALFSAGANAYSDQLKILKSEENVIQMVGTVIFEPTGYSFGRAKNAAGQDLVVLRLKQNDLPLVDVGLSFEGAEQVSKDIAQEISKGPVRSPSAH